jgi:transcriptional regulator with XRE-family HTH domain
MGDVDDKRSLSDRVAEELRAVLARRQISASELARRTGLRQPYLSRRMTGAVPFNLDDLELIAPVLRIEVADLLGDDSGPDAKKRRVLAALVA